LSHDGDERTSILLASADLVRDDASATSRIGFDFHAQDHQHMGFSDLTWM
jgi:hypothetical protein